MPDILEDPVARLLEIYRGSASRNIIALAGYPGSGKSTIVNAWKTDINRKLGPGSLTVLGMDGFHLSKARLAEMDDPEAAFARRGAPYTFDPEGFISKMRELRESTGLRSVGWPGFEHEVGDPVEDALNVPPDAPLLLVEGIYTLKRDGVWAPLEELFDEGWFLDVPLETAMNRVALRHQKAWGISPEEARKRADGNDRLNSAYIAPGRESADYLIVP